MNAAEKPMKVEGGEVNIKDLPKLPQRQDSLNAQLRDLRNVANRLGMYDAADYLRQRLASMNEVGALLKTQVEIPKIIEQRNAQGRIVSLTCSACGADFSVYPSADDAFAQISAHVTRCAKSFLVRGAAV